MVIDLLLSFFSDICNLKFTSVITIKKQRSKRKNKNKKKQKKEEEKKEEEKKEGREDYGVKSIK